MTSFDVTENRTWVPDSCTLPTAQQPLRVAEFDDLILAALIDQERIGVTSLRFTLRAEPEIAAKAAAFAVRESRCCGFFTFTLTIAPLELYLAVEVPVAHVEVLDAVAQQVAAVAR